MRPNPRPLISVPPPLIGGGGPEQFMRRLRAGTVTGRRATSAPDSALPQAAHGKMGLVSACRATHRHYALGTEAEQNPALMSRSGSARFSFAATTKIAPSHLPRSTGKEQSRTAGATDAQRMNRRRSRVVARGRSPGAIFAPPLPTAYPSSNPSSFRRREPENRNLKPFPVPLPLQGKGLGVRSALPACDAGLPLILSVGLL